MDLSPPKSSITRASHPQSLPYDFFESPDQQLKKFIMDTFLDERTVLKPTFKPTQIEQEQTYNSFPSSPGTVSPLISLDSMDFPSPRRVSDFTLSQYIVREIPDLPIMCDRLKEFFKDLSEAMKQTISAIPFAEWRRFFVLLCDFVQTGAMVASAATKDALRRIASLRMHTGRTFLANIAAAARDRVGPWLQGLRHWRDGAPQNG